MARAGRRPVRVCLLPGSLLAAAQLCRHLLRQRLVPAANGSQLGRRYVLELFLRSCGLQHLLNALLRSASVLQTFSGSLGLLNTLLRPLQRGFRLPGAAKALVA